MITIHPGILVETNFNYNLAAAVQFLITTTIRFYKKCLSEDCDIRVTPEYKEIGLNILNLKEGKTSSSIILTVECLFSVLQQVRTLKVYKYLFLPPILPPDNNIVTYTIKITESRAMFLKRLNKKFLSESKIKFDLIHVHDFTQRDSTEYIYDCFFSFVENNTWMVR